MTNQSTAAFSLIVRLWYNTSINQWQGELKEAGAGETKLSCFTGLESLTALIAELADTKTEALDKNREV